MSRLLYLLLPLVVWSCRSPTGPVSVAPSLYPVTQEAGAGARVPGTEESEAGVMEATIAPYRDQLAERMNRIVAQVETPLRKGSPESNLGNWVADIMQAAAREYFPNTPPDFAVTNKGGLRVVEIGAGPLLVSELYELMPFDNELVLLELTGAEVNEFLEHVVAGGGWPVSEEIAVTRTGTDLEVAIGGVPLDPTRTYRVATIDYVANGGDQSSMLIGKRQVPSERLLRDILIEFAGRSVGPINVKSEGNRMRL